MSTLVDVLKEIDELIKERDFWKLKAEALEAMPSDNRPKLSKREVKDIRQAHRNGMSQIDLANNYGVNPATISRTVRGLYH